MITETLGIQPTHRVCLRGITNPIFAAMVVSSVDYPPTKTLSGRFDVIVVQIDVPEDLANIAQTAKHLEATGTLWILYPSEEGRSLDEMHVRTACLAAGLVLRKRCVYSVTHNGAGFAPRARVITGTT